MTSASLPSRSSHSWQLILADLALILFLLALSALPAAEAETGKKLVEARALSQEARRPAAFEVAAAQALFRPVEGGPSLAEWLASQPRDPRATLTVFVRYPRNGEAVAWSTARSLAREAEASGVAVRTMVSAGDEAEVYASLGYDALVLGGGVAGQGGAR
ncbi:MAG TPA: hypothetical protein VLA50_05615 [Erythrobacter sp.]|nr:hypothetical protein [Erythrobacter sp.]